MSKKYVPLSKLLIVGMVIPPFNRESLWWVYKALPLGWWPSPIMWKQWEFRLQHISDVRRFVEENSLFADWFLWGDPPEFWDTHSTNCFKRNMSFLSCWARIPPLIHWFNHQFLWYGTKSFDWFSDGRLFSPTHSFFPTKNNTTPQQTKKQKHCTLFWGKSNKKPKKTSWPVHQNPTKSNRPNQGLP